MRPELCYSHHCAFFSICAKLLVTMAFPFTFLDVIVVSDLKKNIGGSSDLAKKRRGTADLHTPIHPLYILWAYIRLS